MVSIGLLLYDGNNIKYFIVIQKKKLIQITRNINSKKKKCVYRKSVLSFWFAENYVLTVNQLDQTRSMVTNFYTCLAEQNILPFLSFHTQYQGME